MPRQCIDCRQFPGTMNCSIALLADSDRKLLDAAMQHAVTGMATPTRQSSCAVS